MGRKGMSPLRVVMRLNRWSKRWLYRCRQRAACPEKVEVALPCSTVLVRGTASWASVTSGWIARAQTPGSPVVVGTVF